jgi:hypothetical protein
MMGELSSLYLYPPCINSGLVLSVDSRVLLTESFIYCTIQCTAESFSSALFEVVNARSFFV